MHQDRNRYQAQLSDTQSRKVNPMFIINEWPIALKYLPYNISATENRCYVFQQSKGQVSDLA